LTAAIAARPRPIRLARHHNAGEWPAITPVTGICPHEWQWLTIRLSGGGLSAPTEFNRPKPSRSRHAGAANSVLASLPAFPPLWLNEVQAGHLGTVAITWATSIRGWNFSNAGTNRLDLSATF